MSTNNLALNVLLSVFGLMLAATGIYLVRSTNATEGIMLTLPYILLGIGSGVFEQNLGTFLKKLSLKNSPEIVKKLEIEEKDERNALIRNRAKAKAYDLMIFVFGALMLSFALINVNLYVILSFIAAYLLIIFSNVYYLSKYNKEM